jgi:PAS domain S-box-containing protein
MDYVERRRRMGALQSRLLASVAVLLLLGTTSTFERPGLLAALVLAYMAVTTAVWDVSSRFVAFRRLRGIRIVLDLVMISLVVWSTGGIESSWYLLYIFPILSAAPFLGTGRSQMVTVIAIAGYVAACYAVDGGGVLDLYPLGFRALMLTTVALVAALPARTRDWAEAKLLEAIADIDTAVLDNHRSVEGVRRSILDAAMEITHCDLSAICLDDGTEDAATRAESGADPADLEEVRHLIRQYDERIRRTGTEVSLRYADPPGLTAQLVPLTISGAHVGVLGVFSRRRPRYTHDDARRLKTLAHVTCLTLKNARLYRENQDRLEMMFAVGEGLRSEQSLPLLFDNVVRLVADRLGSEEAALFLPGGGETPQLRKRKAPLKKTAVSGPTPQVEAGLTGEDEEYEGQGSLTGGVFVSRQVTRVNHVDPKEPHAAAYGPLLPSGTVRHYLGVPLLIGNRVLGVIRVLNKKRRGYKPERGSAGLDQHGFDERDQDLLSAIATQVASAIRNARFVEQTAYFRNLVDNNPDPIIVIDGSGWVEVFNRASEQLWELKKEQVLGTHVSDLYKSPEHAREIGVKVLDAARRGEGIKDELAWIRKPGQGAEAEIIPIRLAARGFVDQDGQLTGSIGVFTDERQVIAEMKATIRAEQLAALGKLAQTKGHDIKHELFTIKTWMEVLREPGGDDTEMEAYEGIESATEHALAKLQDMLSAAHPKPPQMEAVSLHSLLAGLEARLAGDARASHVTFDLSLPDRDHLLLVDADQMRQLFVNLFDNSLDAIKRVRAKSPERTSSTIRLDARVKHGTVLLSWCDDGGGMSSDALEKAFTPLFTTKPTGTGLGLFIAQKIVAGHGGSIEVEPVPAGACFTITLPVLRPANEVAAAAPSETMELESDR